MCMRNLSLVANILVYLLFVAAKENVKLTGPGSHEAVVGESVTLDCHLDPPDNLGEGWKRVVVEWKFNDKDNVLVYKARGFANNEQADQFRGRASDDSWDLTKGKLAVKISSVTKADAGKYSCSVRSESKKIHFSTQLSIKDSADPHKRAPDQTTPNHSQKSADALVVLVLAASTLLYSL